jgi:hypothetical protein
MMIEKKMLKSENKLECGWNTIIFVTPFCEAAGSNKALTYSSTTEVIISVAY